MDTQGDPTEYVRYLEKQVQDHQAKIAELTNINTQLWSVIDEMQGMLEYLYTLVNPGKLTS